jgi:hypothetical protein
MAEISVPGEQQNKSETDEEPNASLESLAHWSFLIGYVVPFASLIIPLVLFNTTGKEDSFVKANAKEALNLMIFSFILICVFSVLIFVLIGIPLLVLLGLYVLIFPIIAAIQTMGAKKGDAPYRYPLIFRVIA